MQRFGLIYTQSWYQQMNSWQKELVRTSLELYGREERMHSNFADYAFIVFPMAKAYEGFLKEYFYRTGLIDKMMFEDKRFRIGRALNPDMNPDRRDEQWVYGRIAEMCSHDVAREFWDTWLTCRNQVFHYFPRNERKLSLLDAANSLEKIANSIELAYRCNWQGGIQQK
jgi:hypothetical protein